MDFPGFTDEALVKEVVDKGRLEAFGIIYDRYHKKVYSKCIIFVKSETRAEDLTHNIFLKVFMKLSQFSFESKFSTWFYSLTYNECIDQVRKASSRKKADHIELDELEQSSVKVIHTDTDSEQQLLHMEAKTLGKILEKLRAKDKMIFLMKYQDDMSITEIQKEFEIGESAVKMRLLRARERAVAIYEEFFKP